MMMRRSAAVIPAKGFPPLAGEMAQPKGARGDHEGGNN